MGRLGGDEFTALALVNIENYENIMRRRINEVTLRHNKAAGKPYPIEMSAGIYEFECDTDIDIYDLLSASDDLLYEDKKRRKTMRS